MIDPEEIRQEVSRFTDIPAEHLGTTGEDHTAKKHGEVEEYLIVLYLDKMLLCVK